MGWGYGVTPAGREVGYTVECECDWPGCEERIDRGLSYLCGEMHADGQTCGDYFCGSHLVIADPHQMCLQCYGYQVMLDWCDECESDECYCGDP